jgi:hypothetical protein
MWKRLFNFFRGAIFMNHYLVVIDTTNRPFDARAFKPGIQNFYICLAPDEKTAKNIVLNTFRSNPAVIQQLINSVVATPINTIIDLLRPNQALWSYVPIGGMRAPGQQKRIPSPDEVLNPASLDYKNPIPIADNRENSMKPSSVAPPPPQLFDAHVEKSVKMNTKADPMDLLLADPNFKAKLLAKLLGESVPEADPDAAMRYNDPGNGYDDDLAAPPKDVVSSVASKVFLDKVPAGPVPGQIQPDAETQLRIQQTKEKLRQLNNGIVSQA